MRTFCDYPSIDPEVPPMIPITLKCQVPWFPAGGNRDNVTMQARTTLQMAEWLGPIVVLAVNEVDELTGYESILAQSVRVDFVLISDFAINTTGVLIAVNPPEIDGGFVERELRRQTLKVRIRRLLWEELETNCDHLSLPTWELEVVCREASSVRVTPKGEIATS